MSKYMYTYVMLVSKVLKGNDEESLTPCTNEGHKLIRVQQYTESGK